jgi:hypothetical protein
MIQDHIGSGVVRLRSRLRSQISPIGPPWEGLPSRNVGFSWRVPVESAVIFMDKPPVFD